MQVNRLLSLYIDLAFCLVLLPFMIWLLPVDRWLNNNSLFVTLFVGWLYVVYVVNRYIVTPWMFKDKRHLVWSIVIVIVTLIITYFLSQYRFSPPSSYTPRMRPMPGMSRSSEGLSRGLMIIHKRAVWFLYVVVITFSFAVGALAAMLRMTAQRQAIEHEKKKAELALYKAQINPHFLFNTLNTLYGLMLTDVKRAEVAFIQFMTLTKYTYTTTNRDKVPLSDEIDYIREYIELQKNRLNQNTQVHFSTEKVNENSHLIIVPMLLITFVENAFKYGVASHQTSVISIKIRIDGDNLCFTTENPILVSHEIEKSGLGIANCRKRLDLLYPNKHSLEIIERENNYHVTLKINLA